LQRHVTGLGGSLVDVITGNNMAGLNRYDLVFRDIRNRDYTSTGKRILPHLYLW
jgi:hypothetical protein